MAENTAEQKKRMASDAAKVTGATGVAYLFNLFGGLVLAKLLSPSLLGVWKGVQLTIQWTQFSNLGSSYGFQKTCPSYISKGRLARYQRLVGSSLGFSLIIPLIFSLGFLAASFFTEIPGWKMGFLALAVLVPLGQMYHHFEIAMNVEKRFASKALLFFYYTVSRVGLCVLLAYFYGLEGALVGFIVTMVWFCYAMWSKTRLGFHFNLRFSMIRRLIFTGFPIYCTVFGEVILSTTDKWVVLWFLGDSAMGLYSMAIFPLPILMLLPTALRQIVNIEVYDLYGRFKSLEKSRQAYHYALLTLVLVSPFVIGAVYLGIPWLVNWKLEEYQASIPTIKMHAILIFPWLAVQVGNAIYIVSGWERRLFAGQAVVAISCACISIMVCLSHGTFYQVLLVHGTGWLIYASAYLFFIERLLGLSVWIAAKRLVACLTPMALLAVELPLLERVLEGMGFEAYTFLFSVVGGVFHTIFCLPFFYLLERRTHAISGAVKAVRRKLGV